MGATRCRHFLLTALSFFLLLASGPLGASGSGPIFEAGYRLAGPGSSPPTCRSKCGRCYPCKAVHVPIQPGMSIPLEYYPEAWRCKCGNKLFMP